MDVTIKQALDRGRVIDITTTGRTTGGPRRIEIFIHNLDGRLVISGMPHARRRSWLANLAADPNLTIHLKGAVTADLPATAREITDPDERRAVLAKVARAWQRTDVDQMVESSPLIEVSVPGYA